MTLTAADVAEIMRLVEESSFDELTLEIDGLKLSLRRGAPPEGGAAAVSSAPAAAASEASAPPTPAAADTGAQSVSAATVARAAAAPASAVPAASADPNVYEVRSPLLGTFYRAPKPGAPPFVEVGSIVDEDTVVAIIEVMKLMNTVRAGVRGIVTEILARDGELVEYGETILRVRKSN
jgi:acetyl-CoA carboxylase biotin carboxyl carrier protein